MCCNMRAHSWWILEITGVEELTVLRQSLTLPDSVFSYVREEKELGMQSQRWTEIKKRKRGPNGLMHLKQPGPIGQEAQYLCDDPNCSVAVRTQMSSNWGNLPYIESPWLLNLCLKLDGMEIVILTVFNTPVKWQVGGARLCLSRVSEDQIRRHQSAVSC